MVATLAAARLKGPGGIDVTDVVIDWGPDDFSAYARGVWTSVIRMRPDLTHLIYPLIAWYFDDGSASTCDRKLMVSFRQHFVLDKLILLGLIVGSKLIFSVRS